MVKTRISGSRNCIFGRKTVIPCATFTQNLHKRYVTRSDVLYVVVLRNESVTIYCPQVYLIIECEHTYTKMTQIVYVSQCRSFVPLLRYPEMPFLVFTIYTRTQKCPKSCTCVCSWYINKEVRATFFYLE